MSIKSILLLSAFLIMNVVRAQWIKTNGPEGIRIEAFFNKGNIVFAGTSPKGIYKSFNHGLTWVESNSAATKNLDVSSFAADANYLYAGTLEDGVYRSPDNGVTWQAVNTGLQMEGISCLLVANGYLFAGTILNGMYRSPDQGITWENINQSLLDQSYILSMVYQGNRLIVEADNYLFFSTDDGNSWDTDQGPTAFFVIEDFFHHGDTLLASAGRAVFRSTDGGVNWSNANILNDALCGFDSIGDTIYAGYKYGVYRSTDWGLTWTTITSSDLRYGTRFQNDFKISGNNFLTGFEEIGAYVTQNKGVNWTQCALSDFSRASSIDDAMITYNGTVYAGTHSDGVYKTNDRGNTWIKTGTPLNTDTLSNAIVFAMLHYSSDILLAGTCGEGVYRSANNGATWTHIFSGLPQQAGTGFTCVKSLAISGPNIIAALTAGIYYSNDSGLTWRPSTLPAGLTVLEASGIAVRDNIVCVGIVASPGRGIYRSTDYGISFSLADPLLDIITVKEGGGSFMYAGSDFEVSMSNDNGLTWGGIGPGIPPGGGAFTILAWDNYVFIGNNFGVFFSSDNGGSFTDISHGLDPYPHNVVSGLTRDDQYLYAGTDRNAVWRRPLTDIGVVPLTMGELKVQFKDGISRLYWQTFTETNVKCFGIERSVDANNFYQIGSVTAAGNSTISLDYKFDDRNVLPRVNYYRLKIIDRDGQFKYSNIVSVHCVKDNIAEIVPNPFSDAIRLKISGERSGLIKIRLLDNMGRSLKAQNVAVTPGISDINLTGLGHITKGVYFLEVSVNGMLNVYKVVK